VLSSCYTLAVALEARMTVRLDAATRRKVERLAAREGISLNEALKRLVQRAPEEGETATRRRRYRLRPRDVGFGFDITRAKQLAAESADEQLLRRRKRPG
jgi:cytidylate kinase